MRTRHFLIEDMHSVRICDDDQRLMQSDRHYVGVERHLAADRRRRQGFVPEKNRFRIRGRDEQEEIAAGEHGDEGDTAVAGFADCQRHEGFGAVDDETLSGADGEEAPIFGEGEAALAERGFWRGGSVKGRVKGATRGHFFWCD